MIASLDNRSKEYMNGNDHETKEPIKNDDKSTMSFLILTLTRRTWGAVFRVTNFLLPISQVSKRSESFWKYLKRPFQSNN